MTAVTLHFAACSTTRCALLVKIGRETYRGDLVDDGQHVRLGGDLVNMPGAVRRCVPDIMKIASRMSPHEAPKAVSTHIAL